MSRLSLNPVNRQFYQNKGLIGWWMVEPGMQRGGGDVFRDLLGLNNGTLENMGSGDWLATSHPGGFGALDFDGDIDNVDIGTITTSNPLQLGTGYTISFWAKAVLTGDSFQRVIDKSTSGGGANGYAVWINTNGTLAIEIDNAGSGGDFRTDSLAVVAGVWQHWTLTPISSTTMQFYLNGVPITTNVEAAGDSFPPSVETNMRFGTWQHSTGREYKGGLDDVRFLNRSVKQSEAYAMYRESLAGYPNGLRRVDNVIAFPGVAASGFQAAWARNSNVMVQ